MRVGLVCPYDLGRPGGVQQQVLDLGRLLVAEGEAVTVMGPGADAVGDGSYRVVDAGRVRTIRANGSVVPLALGFDVARRIREAACDLDVLHVHEPLMPMIGPAGMRAGPPVVATFHALPPPWMSLAYRVSPKTRFRRAVLTAVSPEAARAPSSLGPVAVIPLGVDIDSYHSQAAKVPKRVVFLGRNEPRKGLQILLQAWPLVRSFHADASLVVIGAEGPSPNIGTDRNGIEYRGRVSEDEKRRLLGEASILAAPNLGGESFGLILVEGLASGCAVVASDIPAFRAVAGAVAQLVRPGDPLNLAQAMSRLLSAPPIMEEMGRAGRLRASDFDWSGVLPRYRACYQKAVENGVRSG